MDTRACSLDGCRGAYYARGHCKRHYAQLLRVVGPLPRPSPEARFWAKVEQDGGLPDYAPHLGPCSIWGGPVGTHGYGVHSVNNTGVLAHRFAYELEVGPVPEGLELDHLCRVPLCVRTSHLEAVTKRENILRGVGFSAKNARKTSCPYGHPYPQRTTEGRPRRRCLTCHAAQEKRRKARLRGEPPLGETEGTWPLATDPAPAAPGE